MKIDYVEIGNRIRAVRERQNLTQQSLAELSNLSVTHVSHIETGHSKASLASIIKIANALNASIDELLCDYIRQAKDIVVNSISVELSDCTDKELIVIEDTIKALKRTLRKAYTDK